MLLKVDPRGRFALGTCDGGYNSAFFVSSLDEETDFPRFTIYLRLPVEIPGYYFYKLLEWSGSSPNPISEIVVALVRINVVDDSC